MGDFKIQLIDNFVPPLIHRNLWLSCISPRWYFGNLSNADPNDPAPPFWRMELDGDAAADALWEHAKPQCDKLVGKPLEVIRQYANGHTYGLGGRPHRDDSREGTYTLLYYPMPDWRPDWDGETIFYKGGPGDDQPQPTSWGGFERIGAIRPVPNRAVLFDARATHVGRAPSRDCGVLRVTVAYKLQIAGSDPAG